MGTWFPFLAGLVIGSSRGSRGSAPLTEEDVRKSVSFVVKFFLAVGVLGLLALLWLFVLGPVVSDLVSSGQSEVRDLLEAARVSGQ